MSDKPKQRGAFWWVDRWRKSTAYSDMSAEAQGVYRNLLDELWLRGGVIPNDEKILRKVGGDWEAWDRVKAVVMARFEVTKEGLRNLTHDEVSGHSEKQSEKGKKRAADAPREGGKFMASTSRTPAGPPATEPAAPPAGHQPQAPAAYQPPYPYPYPLSVSVTATDSGMNQGRGGAKILEPTTASRPDHAPPVSSLNGEISPQAQALGIQIPPGVIQHRKLAEHLTALTAHHMRDNPDDDPPQAALEILMAISTTGRGNVRIETLDLRGISAQWCAVTSHAARKFAIDQGFELPD